MEAFSRKYTAVTGTSLLATIEKKTSGWFEYALMGMVYGPIEWDARLVHEACSRPGTKESALTEILLNRTNTEIEQLKIAYNKIYGKSLTDMVLDDLSFATKKMFQMALHGHRDAEGPIDRNKILADMDIIDQYARSVGEADNTAICSVLITRAHSHLVELSNEFHRCHARPITEIIRKKFSGHMKEGLEFIAEGIKDEGDGVQRDAGELMKAMKGLGTKDTWLIWRIVRAHWNRPRWGHIQQAFASMYNKSLYNWVESETSGAYRDLMLALVRLA
jgi:annexin A7/11